MDNDKIFSYLLEHVAQTKPRGARLVRMVANRAGETRQRVAQYGPRLRNETPNADPGDHRRHAARDRGRRDRAHRGERSSDRDQREALMASLRLKVAQYGLDRGLIPKRVFAEC
jgi:hypothetical protein